MRDVVFEAVAAVAERLQHVRERFPAVDPELVSEVVGAVLGTSDEPLAYDDRRLFAGVEELGRTIASAKAEIAALRVDDITDDHIPSATDELDAIVAHTAAATDQILEVCETLDRVGAALSGDAAAQLQDATTRIYEACSFQDITGQRINKVVATLKTIESKVSQMLATFGADRGGAMRPPPLDPSLLLNGPQLPAAAMDQSDIDKLLASFD